MPELIRELGPLAHLVGVWEGDKGLDIAPDDDRVIEKNLYRERMQFVNIGRVDNHDQILYGLRYATTAWRLGTPDPFHEELGYWLWDPRDQLVLRCFMVPRAVTLIATGKAKADAKSFKLEAKLGSSTSGISSNPFLHREFRTVKYTLNFKVLSADSISYEQNTQLKIKGKTKLFNHRDANTLFRVKQ